MGPHRSHSIKFHISLYPLKSPRGPGLAELSRHGCSHLGGHELVGGRLPGVDAEQTSSTRGAVRLMAGTATQNLLRGVLKWISKAGVILNRLG
jgi:hypothetical protein